MTDRACYLDIVRLVKAIPGVDAVEYGFSIGNVQAAADRPTVVVVNPLSWREVDDFDPVQLVRQVRGPVAVSARQRDESARMGILDRVGALIGNAIGGVSLAGLTLPAWTAVTAGQYRDMPEPDGVALILQVEFRYFIDGHGGRTA